MPSAIRIADVIDLANTARQSFCLGSVASAPSSSVGAAFCFAIAERL
jgi:hypothetical protein